MLLQCRKIQLNVQFKLGLFDQFIADDTLVYFSLYYKRDLLLNYV